MRKFIFALICIILWSFTCLFGGYILGKKLTKPVTITKYETQWKDKIIYKDLSSMSEKEKDKELQCYYQSEFKLDIKKHYQEEKYRITGSLCERSAYKDIEIECGSSGDWKLYAGIGIVGIASGLMLYHLGR